MVFYFQTKEVIIGGPKKDAKSNQEGNPQDDEEDDPQNDAQANPQPQEEVNLEAFLVISVDPVGSR